MVDVFESIRLNMSSVSGDETLEEAIKDGWHVVQGDADFIVDLYLGMNARMKEVVARGGDYIS